MRNAKRFSSPYAPPCTMVSVNSDELVTTNIRIDEKIATGESAKNETTMARGAMVRTAVTDMGEGTRSAIATATHNAQPQVARTIDTASEWSAPAESHGAVSARPIQAIIANPTMTLWGERVVGDDIPLACPQLGTNAEFPQFVRRCLLLIPIDIGNI